MKPGMGSYYKFKEMFERYSKEAGKEQYLIPYFIAAHPGTTDEDMLNLAVWLKQNNFQLDQVQNFMPTPMAMATAMYHGRKNPLHKISADSEAVETVRNGKIRRLHKAFLRYHDPENWPILREALQRMGRSDLIGNSERHLVPRHSGPVSVETRSEGARPARYSASPTKPSKPGIGTHSHKGKSAQSPKKNSFTTSARSGRK
jgi:Domain of unknown function (DUF3362)